MSSLQLSLPDNARNRIPPGKQVPDWRIAMKVKVNANTQRIFNALIEPEYRELWVRFPGQDGTSRIVASQSKRLFRLDYYRSGELEIIIVGSYHACNRRKIAFDWWNGSSHSSTVEVRLDGCFSCSFVTLTHRGLLGKNDYMWHREMWGTSLATLKSLF